MLASTPRLIVTFVRTALAVVVSTPGVRTQVPRRRLERVRFAPMLVALVVSLVLCIIAEKNAYACYTASTVYSDVVRDLDCDTGSPLTPAAVRSVWGGIPKFGPGLEYVVYFNTAFTNHKLLVFVPGSGLHADDYTFFLQRAAYWGYHVIGVNYWNTNTADPHRCNDKYKASRNIDRCRRSLLEFVFDFGAQPDPIFKKRIPPDPLTSRDITVDDSIFVRTVAVLTYLSEKYDAQGWGTYLAQIQNSDFSKMTIAGHSRGSHLTAYIGSQLAVNRVLMFSGVGSRLPDPDGSGSIAESWIAESVTPGTKMFGFAHVDDDSYRHTVLNWEDLGLPGSELIGNPPTVAPWNVRNPIPPTEHQLKASDTWYIQLLPPCAGSAHNSTVRDCWIGNTPGPYIPFLVYQPVWDYMLAHAD